MAARCPGMEPPPRRRARWLSVRGACLTVAFLCALAATTGAVAPSGHAGHHHHHNAIAAAMAGVDTGAAHGKRSAPELAAAERPAADAPRATGRTAAGAATTPRGIGSVAARTRGPPTTV